jgi:hypothetical protein
VLLATIQASPTDSSESTGIPQHLLFEMADFLVVDQRNRVGKYVFKPVTVSACGRRCPDWDLVLVVVAVESLLLGGKTTLIFVGPTKIISCIDADIRRT